MESLSPTKKTQIQKTVLQKIKETRTEAIKTLINMNTSELIILQNVKKYMVNGKLELESLTSKQRSYLHQLAEKYNMKHFSTGNYNNRILTLEDKAHSYFTTRPEPCSLSSWYTGLILDNAKMEDKKVERVTKENDSIVDKIENELNIVDKEEINKNESEEESNEESDEDYDDDYEPESDEESDEEYDEETDETAEFREELEHRMYKERNYSNVFTLGEKTIYAISVVNMMLGLMILSKVN